MFHLSNQYVQGFHVIFVKGHFTSTWYRFYSRETLMCLLSDGDLISISMKHPHCALQKKK